MHDSPAADSAQEQRTRADALPSVLPAWAQAALTSPSQEGFMEVQGAKIHYITWGSSSKPPLVLVHGNAASAEWWRFIAPLLADDHYVIAPDLAGMGDSTCGAVLPYAVTNDGQGVVHSYGATNHSGRCAAGSPGEQAAGVEGLG